MEILQEKENKILEILDEGLEKINLNIGVSLKAKMIKYIFLLEKWNKSYNLTAIKDVSKMVSYILLDSLIANSVIKKHLLVLDVGTGAGIPGIILAIANPQIKFILLDSNKKKLKFVLYAISYLKLSNVNVVHSRIEDFSSDLENLNSSKDLNKLFMYSSFDLKEFCKNNSAAPKFSLIISKAFSGLEDFAKKVYSICSLEGFLFTYKGKLENLEEEEPQIKLLGFDLIKVDKVFIPGITKERSIVLLQKER